MPALALQSVKQPVTGSHVSGVVGSLWQLLKLVDVAYAQSKTPVTGSITRKYPLLYCAGSQYKFMAQLVDPGIGVIWGGALSSVRGSGTLVHALQPLSSSNLYGWQSTQKTENCLLSRVFVDRMSKNALTCSAVEVKRNDLRCIVVQLKTSISVQL